MSSKELTGSMFTRMFYMQGHGLNTFKLVDHQRGLTGTDIYTYKVDWEGKKATIVPDFAPKPKTEGQRKNQPSHIRYSKIKFLNDSKKNLGCNSSV